MNKSPEILPSDFLPFKPDYEEVTGLNVLDALETRGGTSVTYRVLKDDRQYFLKCMKEQLAGNRQARQIFKKEYELGATIDSKNILHYEAYWEKDGIPYILAEYITGRNLSQLLMDDNYKFDQTTITNVITDILKGLSTIHEKGIIHLDLKPENIMIRDVNGQAVIIDLGFCYTDAFMSSLGGTKNFTAPEVWEGRLRPTSTADIYSVGKILQSILAKADISRYARHYYNKVATRACNPDPNKRYQSAAEMLSAFSSAFRSLYVRILLVAAVGIIALLALFYFWTRPDKEFYDTQLTYEVISQDSLTCCVTGFTPLFPNSKLEYNSSAVQVPVSVTHNGYTYLVTGVRDSAFFNRESIQVITFPQTLRYIGENAFSKTSISTLYLPDSLKSIGRDAFQNCIALKEISFPPGLKEIGHNSFVNCRSLERLNIPEGIESIGHDAFVSCKSLREVKFPSTLKRIEKGIFWDCPSLTTVTIPASLTSIGDYVFCYSGLKDLHMLSPTPPRITEIFQTCNPTIHVPKGAAKAYRKAPVWGAYTIVEE